MYRRTSNDVAKRKTGFLRWLKTWVFAVKSSFECAEFGIAYLFVWGTILSK